MVASGHDVPVVMAAPRQLTATGGVPCGLRRGKELGWPPIGEENDMGGGSPVKGGWWCLWVISGEGVASLALRC
jgi:hypothetical protein